jgi:hypothetical protein
MEIGLKSERANTVVVSVVTKQCNNFSPARDGLTALVETGIIENHLQSQQTIKVRICSLFLFIVLRT